MCPTANQLYVALSHGLTGGNWGGTMMCNILSGDLFHVRFPPMHSKLLSPLLLLPHTALDLITNDPRRREEKSQSCIYGEREREGEKRLERQLNLLPPSADFVSLRFLNRRHLRKPYFASSHIFWKLIFSIMTIFLDHSVIPRSFCRRGSAASAFSLFPLDLFPLGDVLWFKIVPRRL